MLRCMKCGRQEKLRDRTEGWPIYKCPDCGDSLVWIDPKMKKLASMFIDIGFQIAFAVCGVNMDGNDPEAKNVYFNIGFKIPYPVEMFNYLPPMFEYFDCDNFNTYDIANFAHFYVEPGEIEYSLLHFEDAAEVVPDNVINYEKVDANSPTYDELKSIYLKRNNVFLKENIQLLQDWVKTMEKTTIKYKCMVCGAQPYIEDPSKAHRCPVCNGRIILTDRKMEQVSNSLYQCGFDMSLALALITKCSDNPNAEKISIEVIFRQNYPLDVFPTLPEGFELLPTKDNNMSMLCYETEIDSTLVGSNSSQKLELQLQKLQDWINDLDADGMKAVLMLAGYAME